MKKLLFLLFCFSVTAAKAQFFEEAKEVVKYEGLFTYYYQESKDKLFLVVHELEKEFLYVNSLSQGIGSNDIGLDRGQLGGERVVKFQKAGNKLLLVQPNLKFRALSNNKLERKSVEEAFAKSVLFGFKIEKQKEGKYLIDLTPFLMQDAHGVANRLKGNGQGSYSLDKSKSAVNLNRTKAFPKNVEFDLLLTFKGTPRGYNIRSVTPTPSLVTVFQHHSFVELPDNQYKPRKFDPRSGSYPMTYMDYATPINQSITKRFIYRHRLEKKDPNALVSEALEPIIYYLDNGTPEPVRSALLEGARWWNQAFEAIGYKNAFQVKILPSDADPLDVRYNVIQWVHRSTRGWSYGGSVSDPRTGEIIKGHVSLGSLRIRQDFLIAQALRAPYAENEENDQFALEMALARIRQLSAHEVGHTLGFSHNFAASTNNRSSVMDYPHPKLALKNGQIDFSEAYDNKIGDWDKVTVAYAYGDFSDDQLNSVLNKAFNSGLRYVTDADARPQGSAHVHAHLWDNGSSVASELNELLKLRKHAIANFSADNIKINEPYSVLEDVFVPLYFFHRYQTEAVTKVIGGLDYSYATKGNNQIIVKRIDGKTERQALDAVLKTLEVQEIAIPKRLLELFPPRAIGYGRTRESFNSKVGVAFDPYGAVETASQMTLSLLLHPQRVNRLIQHKSMDQNQLGLDELLDKLIEASIKKIHKDSYFQELQNVINVQVLQHIFYLITFENSYKQVHAVANSKVREIEEFLNKKKVKAPQTYFHAELLKMIQDFRQEPEDFIKVNSPKIPDGSPIGQK